MLATEVVMTPIEKVVRPARIEDADVLAELVDYAGEGLPSYLWHKIAGPGETPHGKTGGLEPVRNRQSSCGGSSATHRRMKAAKLSAAARHRGTEGSNPFPSSGESASRGILPSHGEKPAFRAGVRARQVQRGQQRRVSRDAWRR